MQSLLLRRVQTGLRFNSVRFSDINFMHVRTLFTRLELGITYFEELRQNAITQFANTVSVEEFKKNIASNFGSMEVHTQRDSLKEYIHLIDGKAEELNTLKSCLIQYSESYNSRSHDVTQFTFGTQIMRLLYLLNLPDEAIKLFKDSDLSETFHQMQTYKVLLSLLHENKRYADVFGLYEEIKCRLDAYGIKPDVTVNCLAFASCYHLNTAEQYEYAQNLWKSLTNEEQLKRTKFLLAGLAIKQDDPQFALILAERKFYVTARFIQLIAYTKLGEFDQSCELLYKAIQNCKFQPEKRKPCFGRQMVDDLQHAIEKTGTKQQLHRFMSIQEALISNELLNDETLDGYLCATFQPMLPKNQYQKMKNKATEKCNFKHR